VPKEPVQIDKKHVVSTEKFKNHVLYAGLLDAAHRNGLRGISTELVVPGTAENGYTWVVRAAVTMESADPDAPDLFTGLGDASPANVNRMMANCLPRMAETRSKARALRDALNLSDIELVDDISDRDLVDAADPKSTPSSGGALRPSSPPSAPTATATATTRGAPAAGSGSWGASTPTLTSTTTSANGASGSSGAARRPVAPAAAAPTPQNGQASPLTRISSAPDAGDVPWPSAAPNGASAPVLDDPDAIPPEVPAEVPAEGALPVVRSVAAAPAEAERIAKGHAAISTLLDAVDAEGLVLFMDDIHDLPPRRETLDPRDLPTLQRQYHDLNRRVTAARAAKVRSMAQPV
jgi:hypothetical protein